MGSPRRPPQYHRQQRGVEALVVGGGAFETASLAEQFRERDRPGARPEDAEGQQSREPVQLGLGRVDTGLAQGGIGLGAHEETERRQVGAVRAGLQGEAAARVVGFRSHIGLVPAQGDRK